MAHNFRNEDLEFLRALATALGRDPDKDPITGISFTVNDGELARVEIKSLVLVDQPEALVTLLSQYKLVKRKEITPEMLRQNPVETSR